MNGLHDRPRHVGENLIAVIRCAGACDQVSLAILGTGPESMQEAIVGTYVHNVEPALLLLLESCVRLP